MMRYCSKACQKSHWKAGHKSMCKLLKAKERTSILDRLMGSIRITTDEEEEVEEADDE